MMEDAKEKGRGVANDGSEDKDKLDLVQDMFWI